MAIRRLSKLLTDLKRKAKARNKKSGKILRRNSQLELMEDRCLMATFNVQIDPQPGGVLDDTPGVTNKLNVAPTEIDFNFESFGSIRLPASAVTPLQQTNYLSQFIKIRRSGFDDSFTAPNDVNDVLITPGFLGLGEKSTQVIMRFNEPLVDDLYQIEIVGNFKNTSNKNFLPGGATASAKVLMDLELGPKVLAVVPQPVTRTGTTNNWLSQADKQVVVYFEKGSEPLNTASAQNKSFYQFFATRGSLDQADQVAIPSSQIQSIVYDPVASTSTITFTQPLYALGAVAADGSADPVRALRLRIGTDETPRTTVTVQAIGDSDTAAPGTFSPGQAAGWSFDTAYDDTAMNGGTISAGATGNSRVFQQAITAQPYDLPFPGGNLEPGHRSIPSDSHLSGGDVPGVTTPDSVADITGGVVTQYYNFRDEIGQDGNARVKNVITEAQKQLAREIFDMYSRYSGIQFIERVNPIPLDDPNYVTELDDIVVATGDFAALASDSVPGGVIGLAGTDPAFGLKLALMDGAETWNNLSGDAPYENGDPNQISWYATAMHEIGHQLGLGHSYDLPGYTVQGSDPTLNRFPAEAILPGDGDIVHIEHIYRPDSKDIDLYKFQIDATGTFNVETMAERLHNTSSLDTYLTIWRETTVTDTDPATGQVIIDPTTQQPVTKKVRELVGRNDDYYSKDSSLTITIDSAGEFGTYYVGVSAKGNDSYDPNIADSGIGGTTEGAYELRVDFFRNADSSHSIKDTKGTLLDGDANGTPGGVNNFWFRVAQPIDIAGTRDGTARTLFVEKTAPTSYGTGVLPNGSLQRPFTKISDAIAASKPFDIIRIIGNGGADGSLATTSDNVAYKLGYAQSAGGGQASLPLEDGSDLAVPKDVTVMIDAGAIFQLRQTSINVGSVSPGVAADRSGSSLQVLGTPYQKVYFTSYNEQSGLLDNNGNVLPSIGRDDNTSNTIPQPGDWGGISFQANEDRADGRFTFDSRGIFINYVNYADIRYGGGKVLFGSTEVTVNPIRLLDSRPTITNNVITASSDAAMSANPDSFEETNFHAPKTNKNALTRLNLDYSRVGPEIHGNTFVRVRADNQVVTNSLNGIAIRSATDPGGSLEKMTVTGHFDDIDITHIVSENLIVSGTPGSAKLESVAPSVETVVASIKTPASPSTTPRGQFTAANTNYEYRITFVDKFGNESPASIAVTQAASSFPLSPQNNGQYITLSGLPSVPTVPTSIPKNSPEDLTRYIGRRVYRRTVDATTGQPTDVFRMVGLVPSTVSFFNDYNIKDVGLQQELLDAGSVNSVTPINRARLDGSLIVDPRIIVKLDSSRIELEQGSTMIAEGLEGIEVIFTSLNDDRWGAGGTFDTRGDNLVGNAQASAGNWAGIEARQDTLISLDHVVVAYGGGTSRISGTAAGFNAVELIQSDGRITNSLFEQNDNGLGGESPLNRAGRGANAPGVVMIKASQPVIANNTFINNSGEDNAVISANVNALTSETIVDLGRQRPVSREIVNPVNGLTIDNDRIPDHWDNNGPLIVGNSLYNNTLNGMMVRGGTLLTQVIFDDTDIVHILLDDVIVDNQTYFFSGQIVVPDFHTYGGLRLESHINESLVVKASGATAGLIATGRPLEIEDRIGGSVQVIGQPGFPVIMTSLSDDTATAGTTPDGLPQGDTDNNNLPLELIAGPERATGNVIDNDLASTDPGFLSFDAQVGGIAGANSMANIPNVGTVQMLQSFLNYIRVGNITTPLQSTNITQGATRAANGDDIVTSKGNFVGDVGQTINWTVVSRISQATLRITNTITFTSASPLGDLSFINSMNADVSGAADILYLQGGSPGTNNFRVTTLSNTGRYGLAQGGVYQSDARNQLINATWSGFAANTPGALTTAINSTAGQTFAKTGVVNGLTSVVDPTLGSIWGPADVSSAMSWVVDATKNTATITSLIDLVTTDPVSAGRAGEWQGITLEEYSNDRNVETIVEQELDSAKATERNGTADNSQFLGYLADNIESGDENLRLGFTVTGTLRSNSDVDVYTFLASAGTEVWIDLDRTTHALDSVVEIIDDLGNKLFTSDNSEAEAAGAEEYYEDPNYVGVALGMQKTAPFNGQDFYTTNPRDAGLRLKLFGAPGQHLYHVRVRSSNPNVKHDVGNPATDPTADGIARGLTKGAYQLQIRLQEVDEVGGSTIRFADLRNAVVGVNVQGLPLHSPLTGEAGEAANESGQNDTRAGATYVGNVLASDRGAISIAGVLGGLTPATQQGRNDIDWYQFDVTYEALQMAGTGLFPLEFDVDYADGLGRPDVALYLYDANGRLIAYNYDSNVSDDRAAPTTSSSIDDLNRGSTGSKDPLIGPIGVPVGTYYLAVAGLGSTANALSNNSTLRQEPLNSIKKVVEDYVEDYIDPLTGEPVSLTTYEPADVSNLLDTDGSSAVPFHLGDVSLFVAQEQDLTENGLFYGEASRLYMVDPYTGSVETEIRNADGTRPIKIDVGDIAFAANRQLYTYELDNEPRANDPIDDAESGRYYSINTGTGDLFRQTGWEDGIDTYELDATGNPVIAHPYNGQRIGYGIQYNAIAFGDVNGNATGERLLAIGNRGEFYEPFFNTNGDRTPYIPSRINILYQTRPSDGSYVGTTVGMNSRLLPNEAPPAQNYPGGAYTDQYEVGEVPTQPILSTINATNSLGGGLANFTLRDGQQLIVNDGAGPITYEFDSGPEIINNASATFNSPTAPGNLIQDGDFFLLDPTVDDINDPSTLGDETLVQFDSGTSFIVNFGCGGFTAAQYDGQTVSITSTAGLNATFEFDTDGTQSTPNSQPVQLGMGTPQPGGGNIPACNLNTVGISGALADAINAANFGVTATAVGNRVSLVGDNGVGTTILPQPGQINPLVAVYGSAGRAPVLQALPADNITAGTVITFRTQLNTLASGTQIHQYYFRKDGLPVAGTGSPIDITSGQSAIQVAAAIEQAISTDVNAHGFLFAKLVNDKVMVNGYYINPTVPYSPGTSGIVDLTAPGTQPTGGAFQVPYEESYPIYQQPTAINPTPNSVAFRLQTVINNNTQFVAGTDLDRINFPDFSEPPFNTNTLKNGVNVGYAGKSAVEQVRDISITTWTTVGTSATGVQGNNIRIPFLASDGNDALLDPTSLAVGDRIAAAINFNQPNLQAVATSDRVTLLNGSISIPGVVTNPDCSTALQANQFYSCGEGPGGTITGMANLNGDVYVVTDAGGLYQIFPNLSISEDPPNSTSRIPNNWVRTRYIGNSDDLVGINFQGLTPGPQDTENGRYANMLFAVDNDGLLYAISVDPNNAAQLGKLQPIFEDGAISVDTGVNEARGLAFSSLDRNLWQVMPVDNAGNQAITERQTDEGHGVVTDGAQQLFNGQYVKIGLTRGSAAGLSSYHFGDIDRTTYDYPGGAHGTVISNEFSLKGYSAQDLPTIYFDFFDDAELTDEFRVSISNNSGDWTSLMMVNATSGGWRQGVVSLAGFAGQENLRIRLDVVTGGDLDVGRPETHGDELYGVAGRFINDGDTVVFEDETFEFNSGYSLVLPTGRQILPGELLRVSDGSQTREFTFIKTGTALPNQIRIFDTDTPRQVAERIAAAITGAGLAITPQYNNSTETTVENDNVVNLQGASAAQLTFATGFTGTSQMRLIGANDYRIYLQEGVAMVDGESITITDFDPTKQPLIFEFNDTTAAAPNNPVNTGPNVIYINYTPASNSTAIAASLRNAIAVAIANGRLSGTVLVTQNTFDVRLQRAFLVTRSSPGPNSAVVVTTDGTNLGTVPVQIHRGMTRIQVADALRAAMNDRYVDQTLVTRSGLNFTDGQVFSIDDGIHLPATFEFDTGFILQIPIDGGRSLTTGGNPNNTNNYILEGDSFTVSDGTNFVTFEFDRGGLPVNADPAHVFRITVNDQTTQSYIARQVSLAIQDGLAGLNAISAQVIALQLDGTLLTNGRVQLGGNASPLVTMTFDAADPNDRTKFGIVAGMATPGVGTNAAGVRNTPIFVQAADTFTAQQVATLVRNAINNSIAGQWFFATIDTVRGNRIDLIRRYPEVQTAELSPGLPNTSPLVLQAKGTLVKGYRDLIYAIGHDVIDAGPLGLEDQFLSDPVDIFGNPDPGINNDILDQAHFVKRGQDNAHEGPYFDDILVGFAERGTMVTYTASAPLTNDTFTKADPLLPFNAEGPYQVEIRRSAVYGTPIQQLVADRVGDDERTFDTNDRLNQSLQLLGRSGADLADGQSFTLGDGVNFVTFEFDDFTNGTSDGVAQGNIAIRFSASDTSDVIGNKIRNAINSNTVAMALDLSAATADGLLQTQTSTDSKVNVHGTATLTVNAHKATERRTLASGANAQDNDYSGTEEVIDLFASDRPVYIVDGSIGDRTDLFNASLSDQDVDLFSIYLPANTRIYIDIDAANLGSTLDTTLRIFSKVGSVYTPLALSLDDASPGETLGSDSYLEFIAPSTGTYVIGVSAGSNNTYDPTSRTGYHPGGSVGTYQLEVVASVLNPSNPGSYRNTTLPSSIDFTIFDETFGDDNRKRDQGQIIIQNNLISNMSQWGIVIDAGARTVTDGNSPHPGSIRQLSQINNNRLVPGVVVANNVIYRNGSAGIAGESGGIKFSGDSTGGNLGPVPFGRIVNNTLYGQGGTLAHANLNDVGIQVEQNASPTLMNNIVANFAQGISVDGSSVTLGTTTQYTVYQGNTVRSNISQDGDFPTRLTNTQPLFVNAPQGNFYLQKLSPAIDSASKSLLDRSEMTRVRSPLDISESPIIAPNADVYGQKRVDDPNASTPQGVGDNNFTDIGAIESADRFGPGAFLIEPLDNGASDLDTSTTSVALPLSAELDTIRIQLEDRDPTTGNTTGTGIDDSTINEATVILRDISDSTNPIVLDNYELKYDSTNDIISIRMIGGDFAKPAVYEVELVNNNGDETKTTDAIRDRAGNLLLSNRTETVNGVTVNVHKYTIAIGAAEDFGDAPSTYPVTRAQDGARHEVIDTFHLGTAVTTLEPDGRPSDHADADAADDGITNIIFVANGVSHFTALASEDGKLDVWLDLDNSGTWEDDEHIVDSSTGNGDLVGGVSRTFNIAQSVMSGAVGGTTYARFRLTKAGIATPTGSAPDGEVEDYEVNVTPPPFRNPNPALWRGKFGLDVDNNGLIEPLDILFLINLFKRKGSYSVSLPSPSPPGPNVVTPSGLPTDRYYDVNGDNVADLSDILWLVRYFNSADYRNHTFPPPSGESAVTTTSTASPVAAPEATTSSSNTSSSSLLVAPVSETVVVAPPVEEDSSIPSTLYAGTNIVVEETTVEEPATANQDLLFASLVTEDQTNDVNDTTVAAQDNNYFCDYTTGSNGDEDEDLLDLLAKDQQ